MPEIYYSSAVERYDCDEIQGQNTNLHQPLVPIYLGTILSEEDDKMWQHDTKIMRCLSYEMF